MENGRWTYRSGQSEHRTGSSSKGHQKAIHRGVINRRVWVNNDTHKGSGAKRKGQLDFYLNRGTYRATASGGTGGSDISSEVKASRGKKTPETGKHGLL